MAAFEEAQAEAETAAAQSPEVSRLTHALETARRLTALLDDEMKLLRTLDVAEMKELADEKAELTADWEKQFARMRDDEGFVASLEPRLRDELVEVMEALQSTAQANARALRAALDAHDRFFRAIKAAAQEQEATPGYSVPGDRHALPPLAAVGVAFDRSL